MDKNANPRLFSFYDNFSLFETWCFSKIYIFLKLSNSLSHNVIYLYFSSKTFFFYHNLSFHFLIYKYNIKYYLQNHSVDLDNKTSVPHMN